MFWNVADNVYFPTSFEIICNAEAVGENTNIPEERLEVTAEELWGDKVQV